MRGELGAGQRQVCCAVRGRSPEGRNPRDRRGIASRGNAFGLRVALESRRRMFDSLEKMDVAEQGAFRSQNERHRTLLRGSRRLCFPFLRFMTTVPRDGRQRSEWLRVFQSSSSAAAGVSGDLDRGRCQRRGDRSGMERRSDCRNGSNGCGGGRCRARKHGPLRPARRSSISPGTIRRRRRCGSTRPC